MFCNVPSLPPEVTNQQIILFMSQQEESKKQGGKENKEVQLEKFPKMLSANFGLEMIFCFSAL